MVADATIAISMYRAPPTRCPKSSTSAAHIWEMRTNQSDKVTAPTRLLSRTNIAYLKFRSQLRSIRQYTRRLDKRFDIGAWAKCRTRERMVWRMRELLPQLRSSVKFGQLWVYLRAAKRGPTSRAIRHGGRRKSSRVTHKSTPLNTPRNRVRCCPRTGMTVWAKRGSPPPKLHVERHFHRVALFSTAQRCLASVLTVLALWNRSCHVITCNAGAGVEFDVLGARAMKAFVFFLSQEFEFVFSGPQTRGRTCSSPASFLASTSLPVAAEAC